MGCWPFRVNAVVSTRKAVSAVIPCFVPRIVGVTREGVVAAHRSCGTLAYVWEAVSSVFWSKRFNWTLDCALVRAKESFIALPREVLLRARHYNVQEFIY